MLPKRSIKQSIREREMIRNCTDYFISFFSSLSWIMFYSVKYKKYKYLYISIYQGIFFKPIGACEQKSSEHCPRHEAAHSTIRSSEQGDFTRLWRKDFAWWPHLSDITSYCCPLKRLLFLHCSHSPPPWGFFTGCPHPPSPASSAISPDLPQLAPLYHIQLLF